MPASRTLALSIALLSLFATTAQADDVIVQGTTDVRDAGLLEDVIVPGFEKAHPGDALDYVAVGSGLALTNAEAGQGDAALVHAPSLEKPFVDSGFSLEPYGRAIFYSDYVILGPTSDPAGVLTNARHNAAQAFKRIAQSGAAGDADFISRGDASGTNTEEKAIWQLTDVQLNTAHEPAGGGGTGNPGWYHKTGTGQADTVQVANQCPFTSGACYDITDRGTFNRLVANGAIDGLKLLADKNDAGAPGGQNLLTNPFTVYAVSPRKVPGVNSGGAKTFLRYLTSRKFQRRLRTYPSRKNPAFIADARPRLTLSDLPKGRVGPNRRITVRGTVSSRLKGAPPAAHAHVLLERSLKRHGKRIRRVVDRDRTDAQGNYKVSVLARRDSRLYVSTRRINPDLSVTPLIASGFLSPARHNAGKVRLRRHITSP